MGEDDLQQCGYIGLIQAAKKYDKKEGKFSTYAYPRIKGAMLDALREQSWLPRSAKDRIKQASSTEDVSELKRKNSADALWASIYSRDEDGLSILGRKKSKSLMPDQAVQKRERNEVLKEAIAFLPETQRRVIEGYFFDNKGLAELGEELGVYDSRVCQLKKRAFGTLARYLRKKGYDL